MRLEDYSRKSLKSFQGLYSRGTDDTVPENHFSDCLNVDFDTGEVKTRPGVSALLTFDITIPGKVRHFIEYPPPNNGAYLSTMSDNKLYSGSTPLAVGFGEYFNIIKLNNRIYFAGNASDMGSGNIKVMDPVIGVSSFRDAAGLAPTAVGAMSPVNGVAGGINAGTYKIAVVYITDSGHYTTPGPKVAGVFTPSTYVAPGAKKLDIGAIPIGPAGTVKRQIIISKANEEEYFFLPSAFGGLINDNTSIAVANIDFDDTTDLIDSADYLFDQLETIPAGTFLAFIGYKLVTGGESGNTSRLRASRIDDIESFDAVDGFIDIEVNDGYGIMNAVILRNMLHIYKQVGCYTVIVSNDVVANWPYNSIDANIGTNIRGIAICNQASKKSTRDFYIVLNKAGILLFDGGFRLPELTWKIEKLWKRFNDTYFSKALVLLDEINHKIYCALALDSAIENNTLLVGDYSECEFQIPNAKQIKWSVYNFHRAPGAIALVFRPPGTISPPIPIFAFGSLDDNSGKLWKLDSTVTTDDGNAIESYIETSLLYWEDGVIHFFTAVRLRVVGTGNLEITVKGEDNILPTSLSTVALATAPGKEVLVRFNFQNEKAKFKFRLPTGTKFTINKIEFFGKPTYFMRPA